MKKLIIWQIIVLVITLLACLIFFHFGKDKLDASIFVFLVIAFIFLIVGVVMEKVYIAGIFSFSLLPIAPSIFLFYIKWASKSSDLYLFLFLLTFFGFFAIIFIVIPIVIKLLSITRIKGLIASMAQAVITIIIMWFFSR